MNKIYDSKQLLKQCDFPNLQRKVGVMVYGNPIPHEGLGGGLAVGFEVEYPILNTGSSGSWILESNWQTEVIKGTDQVVRRLNEVIEELTGHRDRLKVELERMLEESPVT